MSHTDTVRAMYAAFARGDISAITERIDDDVEWEYEPSPADVPWLQARRGHAGVREFFASLGAFEFVRFEPRAVLGAGGGLVVGIVDVELVLKRNGYRIKEAEEIHLFRFNTQGKVQRFRHQCDTHKLWLAHRG